MTDPYSMGNKLMFCQYSYTASAAEYSKCIDITLNESEHLIVQ